MIKKMSDEEYFGHPALSQSQFKEFLKSPMWYRQSLINPTIPSMEMTLGSMVHCLYLEPDLFDDVFKLFKETVGLDTVKANLFRANLDPGTEMYTPKMNDSAEAIVETLKAFPLPSPEQREIAGFTKFSGVEIRGKADWISNDNYIWDLKTTGDLGKWARFNVEDRRYDIQARWYLEVFRDMMPLGFNWLVVSTKYPYEFMAYEAGPKMLSRAEKKILPKLAEFRECTKTDHWPITVQTL
jgi:hypothetical protein